jgi:hypothetical protein
MRHHAVTLALLIAGVVVSRAEEAPEASSGLEKLCSLANAGKLEELREEYLKVQWARLTGQTPCPPKEKPGTGEIEQYLVQRRAADSDPAQNAPLTAAEIEQLSSWFQKQPKVRDRLLLALDGSVDRLPAAARVALKLHERFPKECERFEELLLAFATVWDEPALVNVANKYRVPELDKQTAPECTYEESFDWLAKNSGRMCPWFKTLSWRLLVFVANEHLKPADRDWILQKYTFRPDLGCSYSWIKYDRDKMEGHSKLGDNPYTLPNLVKYGGVCRDQGFFARAVCRAFGIPAYMATGQANTGILHGWVGWVVPEKTAFKLLSHGRYEYDKYFTAEIVHPKSGRYMLDYLVGLEALGVGNDKGYDQAELYYRVWREAGDKLTPDARANLLVSAVRQNAYHREAWLAIGEATARGEIPQNTAAKQWEYLVGQFSAFPDFTFSMLSKFSAIFKTAAEKFAYYEAASKMFGNLKRQDLVAGLRRQELRMCLDENKKDLAAQVATTGLQECAGEGANGVELARDALKVFRENQQSAKGIALLKTTIARTPPNRGDDLNPNWVSLSELLRDAYREIGDNKNADQTQILIDRARTRK